MVRLISLLSMVMILLAACAPVPSEQKVGSDGLPLPKLYRIRAGDAPKIQFRMLDSINALRSASGATPLTMDAKLNAAAATHARDMSVQNRPWLFGSDGSSPLDRLARVGFDGQHIGDAISETYETELETLAAWMDQPDTRRILLDRNARRMGFAWHQESNGKIWWSLVLGT
ncbi:CAP domain-containing protein [Aliishimia ponticola]|uniref:CAP domain-containing protein n=1 Tax=Aliishimia ponticola TaxID=2499833 RepID=A0A4S4N9B1_9RHOB|nr:CAP domain-containing protein [Aliishimia ponticola]THH34668.1 CAP domain-containing protein [Aliishimia ponticola]